MKNYNYILKLFINYLKIIKHTLDEYFTVIHWYIHILFLHFYSFDLFSSEAEIIDQPHFEMETSPWKPFIRNEDKMVTIA